MLQSSSLLGTYVFRFDQQKPILLFREEDVSQFNFFARLTAREQLLFHSRLVASRSEPGVRNSVTLEAGVGVCHCYIHQTGLTCCAITSPDYPQRVIHQYLADCLKEFYEAFGNKFMNVYDDATDQFTWPAGQTLFRKYQDPTEMDKLGQINQELEQVKEVMQQNINDLLQRGEAMENLMEKTGDLSAASVHFYKTTKENNQCCNIGT